MTATATRDAKSAAILAKIEQAKSDLEYFAHCYAVAGGLADDWKNLCRAKATLDALRRCAR